MVVIATAEAYVEARRVLLDALAALSEHLDALVVVGAQAVYLRTADLPLATAPYTTDGDIAINVRRLGSSPTLGAAMEAAHFQLDPRRSGRRRNPGQWWAAINVAGVDDETSVDLLVPEADAPPGGTRGARLPDHGRNAARKVAGLEAAVWDCGEYRIGALDPADPREFVVNVAGAAALLVAKGHKIQDRLDGGQEDRLHAKDAADVYRLAAATPRAELIASFDRLLGTEEAATSTRTGVELLRSLFSRRRSEGVQLASEALTGAVTDAQVAAVLTGLVADLPD